MDYRRSPRAEGTSRVNRAFFVTADGYTISDVVMYWRDDPVVGVMEAQLPQFSIVGFQTNERKIKLATG